MHALEHIDLFLFITVALIPPDARFVAWSSLFYLVLGSACAAFAPIRNGDSLRALCGVLMVLNGDWYTYKTYWLAAARGDATTRRRCARAHASPASRAATATRVPGEGGAGQGGAGQGGAAAPHPAGAPGGPPIRPAATPLRVAPRRPRL